MLTKSRRTFRRRVNAAPQVVEGPFAPTISAKARHIVQAYRVLLEPAEGGGFSGCCVEVPTAFAKGLTADACVKATRKAAFAVVAFMLERGRPVPRPSRKRTQQVNIRLSAEEKVLLKALAQAEGFSSLSDLVRRLALDSVSRRS